MTQFHAPGGPGHEFPGAGPRSGVAMQPHGGRAGAGLPLGPQFVQPLPKSSNVVMTVVTIVIIVIAVLLILGILMLAMLGAGPVLTLAVIPLAIIPLTFVWFVVWFIDRWEPEPPLLLIAAVVWGGGFATGIALLVGTIGKLVWPGQPEWWGASVEAPIIEEIAKGLGVLIILFAARKHFQGPTDGLVFGALTGAGFAFTENILYFSSVSAQGFAHSAGAGIFGLGFQFLIRGVALPLLHPICASLTGAAIGWGARRGGLGLAVGGYFLGLIPAALIHTTWNTGSTLAGTFARDEFGAIGNIALLFFAVMVPIFIGWIVLVVLLRRGDHRLIRGRLGEYAQVGWYSPAEIDMLATMRGRTNARRWARDQGPVAKQAMRRFIETSSRLAHTRQLVIHQPTNEARQRDELELLDELGKIRRTLNDAQCAGAMRMQTAFAPPTPPHLPQRMPTPMGYHPQGAPAQYAAPHGVPQVAPQLQYRSPSSQAPVGAGSFGAPQHQPSTPQERRSPYGPESTPPFA